MRILSIFGVLALFFLQGLAYADDEVCLFNKSDYGIVLTVGDPGSTGVASSVEIAANAGNPNVCVNVSSWEEYGEGSCRDIYFSYGSRPLKDAKWYTSFSGTLGARAWPACFNNPKIGSAEFHYSKDDSSEWNPGEKYCDGTLCVSPTGEYGDGVFLLVFENQ